jgi:holin-like protein
LDFLVGFAILTGFFLLGNFLHGLGFPIPGGVLGLILFFLALSFGVIKLKWVERTAGIMVSHMVLLFVPLGVALIEMGPVLKRQALAISVSLVVSWAAVVVTTGLLGRWLLPEHPVATVESATAQPDEPAPNQTEEKSPEAEQ